MSTVNEELAAIRDDIAAIREHLTAERILIDAIREKAYQAGLEDAGAMTKSRPVSYLRPVTGDAS